MGSILFRQSYTTNFAADENPLSEGGRWRTGATHGTSWQNIRTTSGLAYGTQTGDAPGAGQPNYDDSVAVMTGFWGRNQTVTATVKTVNQNATALCEVELWVRARIEPGRISGYECAFRCHASSNPYIGIVRWNGPLNDFTALPGGNITGSGLHDGDTIKITISGFTIEAFINGVSQGTRTDNGGGIQMQAGAPGFGHWWHNNGATGVSATDYGLTSFAAQDF